MSYRSSLLSIEQEILLEQGRDGNYPLSRLHFHISPYLVLFSSLVSLLDEIGSAADGFGVGLLSFFRGFSFTFVVEFVRLVALGSSPRRQSVADFVEEIPDWHSYRAAVHQAPDVSLQSVSS